MSGNLLGEQCEWPETQSCYASGMNAGRADRRNGSQRNIFLLCGYPLMHRRYLSCTVSRCAELPPSFNFSKPKYPTPNNRPNLFKPSDRKKRKEPQRHDSFKLDAISNDRFLENVKPLTSERKPARERGISEKSFRMAQATSYKLLRDVAFSKTIVEGAKGDRVLKSMVERAEARAMVLNEPKTTEIPFLGLSDEVFQDVSFAPGTFIEARRFVFTL